MKKTRLDLESDNNGNFDYELVKKAMMRIIKKTRVEISSDDLRRALNYALIDLGLDERQIICYGDLVD